MLTDKMQELEAELRLAQECLSVANANTQHLRARVAEIESDRDEWKKRAEFSFTQRDKLEAALAKMRASHPEAACYDVPTWNKLKAENEALRKDAERYRYLRGDSATEFGEPWAITRYEPGDERNIDGGTCPLIFAELDSAIDSAMKGEGK